jgi:hypothetical protein
MTTIFEVMTWGHEGTRVDGQITSRRGQGVDHPLGIEFGLQLLMDAWFQGLGTMTLDKHTAAEFEECFELLLGKQVCTDADGYLLDAATKTPIQPRVKAVEHFADRLDGSSGSSGGYDYLVLKPSGAEFQNRASAIIGSFAITGAARRKAAFTIEATDPRYVAHMHGHLCFQTAFTGGHA